MIIDSFVIFAHILKLDFILAHKVLCVLHTESIKYALLTGIFALSFDASEQLLPWLLTLSYLGDVELLVIS